MTRDEGARLDAFIEAMDQRMTKFEERIEAKVEGALNRVTTLEVAGAIAKAVAEDRAERHLTTSHRVRDAIDFGLRAGGLILAALTAAGKVHI